MDPTLAGILQKLEMPLGSSAELLQQLQPNSDGNNSARTSVAQIQALVQTCAQ